MRMNARPAPTFSELLTANFGLVLMVFSWGAFFPILERLLTRWDVYSATLGRQLFGTIVLFACVYAMRRRAPLPPVIPWRRILILGATGVAISSLLTSFGVMLSDGLTSAIISTTNPIGSALTVALLYREPLGRGIALGTALSVAGGLVSVMGGHSMADTQFQGGEILIVLANVLWTWMSMAAQRWLKGFSQLQITAFTVGAGALWLVALMPFVVVGNIVQLRIDLAPEALAMVIFAGVFPIAFGNFCWHYGVSRVGIMVAAMYNNLLPAVALAITVLLGGGFTWPQLIGSAIILTGVFTAQLFARRRKQEAFNQE